MSAIDWVLLAIVVVSALLGLMRGFVGVVLSLLSWLLAGWVAFHFGSDAAVMLASDQTPSPGYLLAGYVLSFGGVVVVVSLFGWFVRRTLEAMGLSGLDRGLGLVVGLARGGLLACVLVLLMGFTSLPREQEWRKSQVLPVFEPGARGLRSLLPVSVAQQVNFEAGGPISEEALRQNAAKLEQLKQMNRDLAALGDKLPDPVTESLPANPKRTPLPARDPAAVDNTPPDPRHVQGSGSTTRQD
jgi:membrane protein required for colicin V production